MSDPTPPRYLKPMNKIVMGLQKLGIQTGPAMVLTVPGRKSGQPRSTPMSPFEFQGQLYTVRVPARRLGAQRPGRRCRDARTAESRVGSGSSNSARTKRVRCCGRSRSRFRSASGFGKRSGLVREGTPDEFEALAGRCPVFRFDPDN